MFLFAVDDFAPTPSKYIGNINSLKEIFNHVKHNPLVTQGELLLQKTIFVFDIDSMLQDIYSFKKPLPLEMTHEEVIACWAWLDDVKNLKVAEPINADEIKEFFSLLIKHEAKLFFLSNNAGLSRKSARDWFFKNILQHEEELFTHSMDRGGSDEDIFALGDYMIFYYKGFIISRNASKDRWTEIYDKGDIAEAFFKCYFLLQDWQPDQIVFVDDRPDYVVNVYNRLVNLYDIVSLNFTGSPYQKEYYKRLMRLIEACEYKNYKAGLENVQSNLYFHFGKVDETLAKRALLRKEQPPAKTIQEKKPETILQDVLLIGNEPQWTVGYKETKLPEPQRSYQSANVNYSRDPDDRSYYEQVVDFWRWVTCRECVK